MTNPITIGMGWDFFTNAEKYRLLEIANFNKLSNVQLELATLPFLEVRLFSGVLRDASDASLWRKLFALNTGHIDKMRRLG